MMVNSKPHLESIKDLIEIKHGFAFPSRFFGTKGDYILLTPKNFREVGGYRDLGAAQKRYNGPVPIEFILERGDVLIAMTEQSPGLLGSTMRVPVAGAFLHNQRLGLLRVRRLDRLCVNYLYHAFNAPHVRKFISATAAGTKVKHTSPSRLASIKIFVPSTGEQQRAAALLDEWDFAIEAVEQLIAAKESAGRCLMQLLFRGDSALQLPRLHEFTRRVTRKNASGDGEPLSISGSRGLVRQTHYFAKRIAADSSKHYTLLKRGEFAYNKSSSAGYPFGAIKRLDACDEGIVSTLYLCFALEGSRAPLSDYFVYYCESGGFNRQIYKMAQEGARNHGLLNVAARDFFHMSMPVPPRESQVHVVNVLDAAHRELSLLREQLAALRAQKRGLMQKLLTGEWRLPPSPAAPPKETG